MTFLFLTYNSYVLVNLKQILSPEVEETDGDNIYSTDVYKVPSPNYVRPRIGNYILSPPVSLRLSEDMNYFPSQL